VTRQITSGNISWRISDRRVDAVIGFPYDRSWFRWLVINLFVTFMCEIVRESNR